MARLPQINGDDGAWGQILNDYLSVSHNADGTEKATGSTLPPGGSTGQVLTKESSIDGDADWEDAPGGGSQTILKASVTFDAAALAQIGDNGCQIVAPPGAGKAIYASYLILEVVPGETPYTAPGGNLFVGGNNSNAKWYPLINDQIMTSTGNRITATSLSIQDGNVDWPAGPADNDAMMLWEDTGDFTDGDGTLIVTLFYFVVDIS